MTEKAQNDYALTAYQTRELLQELVDHIDDLKAPEFATYGDLADLDRIYSQLKQLRDSRFGAEAA